MEHFTDLSETFIKLHQIARKDISLHYKPYRLRQVCSFHDAGASPKSTTVQRLPAVKSSVQRLILTNRCPAAALPQELKTLSGELETTPRDLATSPAELETSPAELETSSGELETSPAELETSSGELETSPERESEHDENSGRRHWKEVYGRRKTTRSTMMFMKLKERVRKVSKEHMRRRRERRVLKRTLLIARKEQCSEEVRKDWRTGFVKVVRRESSATIIMDSTVDQERRGRHRETHDPDQRPSRKDGRKRNPSFKGGRKRNPSLKVVISPQQTKQPRWKITTPAFMHGLFEEFHAAKLGQSFEICEHQNSGGNYNDEIVQQNVKKPVSYHEQQNSEVQDPISNTHGYPVVRTTHLKTDVPHIRLIYKLLQCTLRCCQTTAVIPIVHQNTLSLLYQLVARGLSIVRNNHFLVGYHTICIRFTGGRCHHYPEMCSVACQTDCLEVDACQTDYLEVDACETDCLDVYPAQTEYLDVDSCHKVAVESCSHKIRVDEETDINGFVGTPHSSFEHIICSPLGSFITNSPVLGTTIHDVAACGDTLSDDLGAGTLSDDISQIGSEHKLLYLNHNDSQLGNEISAAALQMSFISDSEEEHCCTVSRSGTSFSPSPIHCSTESYSVSRPSPSQSHSETVSRPSPSLLSSTFTERSTGFSTNAQEDISLLDSLFSDGCYSDLDSDLSYSCPVDGSDSSENDSKTGEQNSEISSSDQSSGDNNELRSAAVSHGINNGAEDSDEDKEEDRKRRKLESFTSDDISEDPWQEESDRGAGAGANDDDNDNDDDDDDGDGGQVTCKSEEDKWLEEVMTNRELDRRIVIGEEEAVQKKNKIAEGDQISVFEVNQVDASSFEDIIEAQPSIITVDKDNQEFEEVLHNFDQMLEDILEEAEEEGNDKERSESLDVSIEPQVRVAAV
eukprot:sb/3461835/